MKQTSASGGCQKGSKGRASADTDVMNGASRAARHGFISDLIYSALTQKAQLPAKFVIRAMTVRPVDFPVKRCRPKLVASICFEFARFLPCFGAFASGT